MFFLSINAQYWGGTKKQNLSNLYFLSLKKIQLFFIQSKLYQHVSDPIRMEKCHSYWKPYSTVFHPGQGGGGGWGGVVVGWRSEPFGGLQCSKKIPTRAIAQKLFLKSRLWQKCSTVNNGGPYLTLSFAFWRPHVDGGWVKCGALQIAGPLFIKYENSHQNSNFFTWLKEISRYFCSRSKVEFTWFQSYFAEIWNDATSFKYILSRLLVKGYLFNHIERAPQSILVYWKITDFLKNLRLKCLPIEKNDKW